MVSTKDFNVINIKYSYNNNNDINPLCTWKKRETIINSLLLLIKNKMYYN